MTAPLVSVVIPCYNGSAFLDDCIRSVLDQRTPCEIILVDDGSTDDSLQRARAWLQDRSATVILIGQHNQGPAAARNTGLRMAAGKYVCFLDVDDQYAPDFFRGALELLEADAGIVAVSCQIEFVNAHRPLAPWQCDVLEHSLPSNVVVRTEVARQLGGFPTDAAFRGAAAGEDCAFRSRLPRYGKVVKIAKPLLRHLARRGSHLDFFLDRAVLRDGRVEFTQFSREESDGSLNAALRHYDESIHQRATARAAASLAAAWDTGKAFQLHAEQFEPVEGFLHALEGFVLYWMARHWPADGRVVELGSFKGRSTCWLAAGCKEGKKDRVAAVDHFRGSPEHQPGGSHEDAGLAAHGATLPIFQANLQNVGLAECVTVHVGHAAEVCGGWRDPIRLLFLDADNSYESTSQDLALWSQFVSRHGVVVLHDVGVWPGPTRCYDELGSRQEHWRALGRFHSLGILERLA